MSKHSHASILSDEALPRLILNAEPLSPDEQQHLARCSHCQQRLSDYQRLHQTLRARLYRTQCPDVEQLSLYSADMLPQKQRQQVAQHIEQCPRCALESAAICQFLANCDPLLSYNIFHIIEDSILK